MRLNGPLFIALAVSLVLLAGCAVTPPAANAPAGAPAPGPASSALTGAQVSAPAQSPAESAPVPAEPAPATLPATPAPAANSITLTAQEVAKHTTVDDCWMIINGNVYDVSGYAYLHPGGPAMAQFCGTDATQAFETKGGTGKGPHSAQANELLSSMLIGPLGSTVTR